ncbi:MAG TPA: carboxypeptidase regulatory-like domain-containing protein, partial [Pyrinomonadaceae bacterium]
MKRKLSVFPISLALIAFLALVLLPATAHAQLTRGSIVGTVHDESGAVVPGAAVTVTNPQTGQTREAVTNDDGYYRVTALDPGNYVVAISKAGFGKVENREVAVRSALDTTFDVDLKVGNITGTVDVTAETEAISLNKTNGTIGLTVSPRQVVELPISSGRDINQLALLSPNAFSAPGSTGISVNGQRARNNNFTIDGSDNNDITVTLSTTPVPPEAVAEFQVQTNPYSVEYGRNSGAQINVITKSGTNLFHGDLYEYYRGSRLNALDNVEKRNLQTRPSRFNRNQFGFTIGGPVLIPGFGEGGHKFAYDGRNRTFFFFAFQGDRLRSAGALQTAVTIPTATGFAALGSVNLRPGQSAASRAAVINQLSFLGGVYAQNPTFSRVFNNTAANCVGGGTFVAATQTTPARCNNGQFIELGVTTLGVNQPNNTSYYLARVDHKFGDNDNANIRYIGNKSIDTNVVSNLTFGERFAGAQNLFDQNLAISETHIFSQNIVNEVRASYIRRNLDFPENDTTTLTTTISGLFAFGGASNFPQSRVTDYYQLSDTMSWQRGNHALKFGFDIRRNELYN